MKSKKKTLALLLALMMVISMNPAVVFSQDIASTDPPAGTEESANPAVPEGEGTVLEADGAPALQGGGTVLEVAGEPAAPEGEGTTLEAAGEPAAPEGEGSSLVPDSEAGGEDEEDVTPEDVHKSLDAAIDTELEVAVEFIPSSDFWNEFDAALNDAAADNALTEAEGTVEEADKAIDAAATATENDKDQAVEASNAAQDDADNAEKEAGTAATEKGKAGKAKTKAEAQQAADVAKEASARAQKEALEAVSHADTAAAKAAEAKDEYDKAKAAYDAAQAEVDAKLEQGLIDAREAADLTAAVKKRADEAYDKMIKAQEEATRAAEEAAQRAEAADALLDRQIEELDQIIKDTASDVAQKTGTAAVTGAALAAAKIAAEASKLEVSYYEGRLETKEESLADLNKKIEEAEIRIRQARVEVDLKKTLLDQASSDYEEKKAALEKARADLDTAQKAVDSVKEIIRERDESGIKDALESVRRSEDYSTDDVHSVAEYLMDNDPGLVWDQSYPEGNVFCIGDQFYIVSLEEVTDPETGEVTDRVVKVSEYFPEHYEKIEVLPSPEEDWKGGEEAGIQTTEMKASDDKGRTSRVFITKTSKGDFLYQIKYKDKLYTVHEDKDGFFITNGSIKLYFSIEAPKEAETGKEVADTAGIARDWDDATAKEAARDTARTAVIGAWSARNIAAAALGKAQRENDSAEDVLKFLEDRQAARTEKRDELAAEVSELDDKLNGNIAEQFVVAYIDGGMEGVSEKLVESIGEVLGPEELERYNTLQAEIDDLQSQLEDAPWWKKAAITLQIIAKEASVLGIISDVIQTSGIDLEEIQQQGAAIVKVLDDFRDGNISLDDVKDVGDLLLNSGLSAMTRNRIIDKIVGFLTTAHHNAVVDLETSVRDGAQNVSDATESVARASAGAVATHTASAVADAAKKIADARAKEAAEKKAAADKAADAAVKALKEYEELAGSYGPNEDNLDRAYEAYQTAQAYADRASSDLIRAEDMAKQAAADAEAAQKAADPEPPTPPTPDPDPVDPVNPVTPVDPVVPVTPADTQGGGSGSSSGRSSGGSSGSGTFVAASAALTNVADTVSQLGRSIASFAASLMGNRYAEAVGNDSSKLNSKSFVDYVYSNFGIRLDLSGKTAGEIAANGTPVDKDKRQAGDLLVLTDKDGVVTGYAVNYDKSSFIRYSKKSGKVESFDTSTLNGNYSVTRVD